MTNFLVPNNKKEKQEKVMFNLRCHPNALHILTETLLTFGKVPAFISKPISTVNGRI